MDAEPSGLTAVMKTAFGQDADSLQSPRSCTLIDHPSGIIVLPTAHPNTGLTILSSVIWIFIALVSSTALFLFALLPSSGASVSVGSVSCFPDFFVSVFCVFISCVSVSCVSLLCFCDSYQSSGDDADTVVLNDSARKQARNAFFMIFSFLFWCCRLTISLDL